MKDERTRAPSSLPWLLQAVLCAAAAWGCWKLWPIGQQEGQEVACAMACVLFCLASTMFFRAVEAWDYSCEMRRLRELSSRESDVHGDADWANEREVRKAGLFKGQGSFIGSAFGRDIRYPSEAHVLTIAPAGAGKGTGIVGPTCLTYPGSMVVSDPKGELTAMYAKHREKFGEVVVLKPYRVKLAAELEQDLGGVQYNPLSILKPGEDAKDDARLLAGLLVPGQPGMSESETFFLNSARAILVGTMLHLLHCKVQDGEDPTVTLPELRTTLMADAEGLFSLLALMATSEGFGGAVAECGKRFWSMLEHNSRQFAACLSSATEALEIYDSYGPLGQHVSGGDFTFAQAKQKTVTVFVILPSNRQDQAAWQNLVLSTAIEQVGRDRSNKRVLFLLDEFANLGYMPGILRAMSQYRGQGVMIHAILQQLSQLERIYKDGWREFVGLSELINIFGVWEPQTIELISKWMGTRTVQDLSFSSYAEARFTGGQDVSISATDRARDLAMPSEVRTMPQGQQIVFYRNLPPLIAKLVSYRERRAWKRLAAENPYHRRRAHAAARSA